jgi:fission process protein 1
MARNASAKTDATEANGGPPGAVAPGPLPEREALPPSLQKIVDKADKDESFYDELWDGT